MQERYTMTSCLFRILNMSVIFTFVKEVMFYQAFVRLYVCLSAVCRRPSVCL